VPALPTGGFPLLEVNVVNRRIAFHFFPLVSA
jgi:hypothetical protein